MKKSIKILAIETSCDETAAAVIINGEIKSNIIASQADLHAKFGGIVPEVAAREHVTAIIPTVDLALKKAELNLKDIDYVAVTAGPGLMTSLLVGVDTAKALAQAAGKPLIPINHLEAHVYANLVSGSIIFPAIILIVSGGHTLLVLMKKHGHYQLLGETLDDAAGEAFDKTAKLMGLGYPGGPQISKYALSGDPKRFVLPRPMLKDKTLNMSFSGLKTAVLYEYNKHSDKSKKLTADMAASVQQAIIETLMGKLEQAIQARKPKAIMLGGGVAANKDLRSAFAKLAKKYNLQSSIPEFQYCTDNAAMIGLAAYYRIKTKKAKFADAGLFPNPQMRLV